MRPSLDQWLASRPECPDCGQKLHPNATCPARSRIHAEAMQHKQPKRGAMSTAVTTKQGTPSKSGEVIDTDAAKVVPPSPEVQVHTDGARSAARTKATVGKAVAKMTGKKGTTKGTPVARLTDTWPSAKGKDVAVKDTVKTKDGTSISCVGRWTKKTAKGNVPMITGVTSDGTRKNSPAAEVTHTK
jgi:hypothetical protein